MPSGIQFHSRQIAQEVIENWATARSSLLRPMPRCIGRASNQVSLVLLPVLGKVHISSSCANLREPTRVQSRHDLWQRRRLDLRLAISMQLDVVITRTPLADREQMGRWATDGGSVGFSLMQLHPSRFHSSKPLWVDCLGVLAVGDKKAYIPASSSTRPRGPTLVQVPWYVDSRLDGATGRRPTMPCRSKPGDLERPQGGCPVETRFVPR